MMGCETVSQPMDTEPAKQVGLSNDPLVNQLRNMTFADFQLIEVNQTEPDGMMSRMSDTNHTGKAHDIASTPYFTDFEWWVRVPNPQTPPYYYGNASVPWTNLGADLETFMYLPSGMVAVGLGGRSTNDNFSNSGIYGRYFNADYSLGNFRWMVQTQHIQLRGLLYVGDKSESCCGWRGSPSHARGCQGNLDIHSTI